jgi:hypothetical protein
MKTFTKNVFKIASISLMVIFFVSCGNSNKKQSKAIAKEEIKVELQEIAYPLPSPFELTEMINKIEANYIIGIANKPSDFEKYLSETKQCLNLGVYSSDLAYSSTYNISDLTQEYLNTIIELVKALDLTGAIDADMPSRVEASLEDKTKSVDVITDLLYSTYSYMNRNNNAELSNLILAGTWIEGMYLINNISENTFENIEILKIIAKQESSLKKIIELMTPYKDSEISKEIYVKLSEINSLYELQEGTNSLTIDQMTKLFLTVEALRSDIIK